jgi:lipopolysaccharide transport system permease protein
VSAVQTASSALRIRDATLSGRIRTGLSDLVRYRHLIWYMAMSSLAVDSRGTKLGRSWWVIEPLLLMGVYTLLVKVVFHAGGANFPLVVLAAILAFEFFARSVARSMAMLRTAQTSMLSVSFPRTVIPLAVTLSELVQFAVSVVAFVGIAAAFGILPKPAALLAVPFIAMEVLFTLGASYFFAATGVFFRDLSKITDYLFWILFQLGCGMITLDLIPASARRIVLLNPFTTFFEGVRAPLLYGKAPDLPLALVSGVAVLSVLLCVGGFVYFLRREGSFNKVVL